MRYRAAASSFAVGAIAASIFTAAPAFAQDLESLRGTIRIDGSSTVYPITEAVAEEFGELAPNVRVTVGISGTGGGFKRFAAGETDVSDASRPIKEKEYKQAMENKIDFIEIPVAYDGLSIVVNKANYWCDTLTVDELKRIFLEGSTVNSWKDVRVEWPDVPLKIFAPGTDSGTFDYFKEVVAGKTGSIRNDMSVSEDDNVLVRGVAGSEGGIGFFGCAYFFENEDQLKAVSIINPDTGKAVAPTRTAIEEGSYAPFSRPLFIYVNAKSADKPEVDAFINFYFKEGSNLTDEVGYVRLPKTVIDNARYNYKRRKTGTQFMNKNMEKVTGSVTEIYKRIK